MKNLPVQRSVHFWFLRAGRISSETITPCWTQSKCRLGVLLSPHRPSGLFYQPLRPVPPELCLSWAGGTWSHLLFPPATCFSMRNGPLMPSGLQISCTWCNPVVTEPASRRFTETAQCITALLKIWQISYKKVLTLQYCKKIIIPGQNGMGIKGVWLGFFF